MNKATFSVEAASILKQCFDELNQLPSPPIGLLIGLDALRSGLAEIGRIAITADMMNAANIELLEALQSLGIIHAQNAGKVQP